MWMWHRRLKRDVFVANVNGAGNPWRTVIYYLDGAWEEDVLGFFEPPHEH